MRAFDHSVILFFFVGTLFVFFSSIALASDFTWTNDTAGTSASGLYWGGIASSDDGTKLVAVQQFGDIYTSTNSGATWTNETTGTSASDHDWYHIASSADGTKLAAVAHGGDIWTSTDSGASWANRTTATSASGLGWSSITSSSDGTKLAAVSNDFLGGTSGDIWTSSDAGVTWTNETAATSAHDLDWVDIASSDDGTKLAATETNYFGIGDIWTSTDGGHTWTNDTASTSLSGQRIASIASSADGTKLVANVHAHNTGDIWTSTNSGMTWTDQTGSRIVSDPLWNGITSSSDGTKLAVTEVNDDGATTTGDVLTSNDGGVTWTDQTASSSASGQVFAWLAASADGTKLLASTPGGDIWTGIIPPPTPPPTPAPSSGGGWSGGCSTYPQGELPSWGVVPCVPTNPSQGSAVLPAGIKTPPFSSLASSPTPTSSSSAISFPTNHQLYDVSSDIKLLQQFLNTHGYIIATTGPGSPGNETTFFGIKTYQALIEFQKANNLPATGFLGPLTRAILASLSATTTTQ
jgi:hypothetical protein